MTALGNMMSKVWKSALGALFLLGNTALVKAQAPAPYLLPYTINTIAGGGTAPAVGAACPGANGTTGNTGKATDVLGDGCLASSSSVVTSVDLHDVGVDSEGNVYFIDNSSPVSIRRIDAHSGLITVFAGGGPATPLCAAAIDKYGDGCPANDGAGNIKGGFTSLTTSRGIGVVKNGDVYLAHYSAKLISKISASNGVMTLIAGALTGTPGPKNAATGGYTGDGGPATSAEENQARGVTADVAGNVYFADSSNNVVRMVNTAGIVSTIVSKYPGSNTAAPASFTGDGGPATAATLNTPEDVEIDANGNLFIADQGNSRVRVVYASGAQVAGLIAATNNGAQATAGNIYTIMGGSTTVYTPNTVVLATSVAIAAPRKIALDARGNIYLADNSNNVIWFEDGTTGYMRVIAGSFGLTTGGPGCGQPSPLGDNCQATLATLNPNSAMGVGVDAQGNVYISDSGDQRIRKVSVNQVFPTVASGSSITQTLVVHFAVGDTPAATSPFAVAGSADFVVSPPSACTLNSDQTTDCTITVTFSPTQPGPDLATLVVKTTLGATSQLGLNGVGSAPSIALDPGVATGFGTGLKSSAGVALDAAGNAYVADTGNNVVIRYDSSGTGTVIAGTGAAGNSGNGGPATSATLSAPSAVTVTPDGAVYIADTGNSVVRRIDPTTGVINIAAGAATTTCAVALDAFGNGCLGTQAKLAAPAGLASDVHGNVYIADTGNNVIRELTNSGYIFAIGGPSFSTPTALEADPNGNIFVADTGSSTIREIVAATGTAVAVAGNGQNGSTGNGGAATSAELSNPTGIALDAAGDLYIADTGNHVIRLVNAAGTINTVAGTLGQSGSGTLPGSVNGLLLNLPAAVAATTSGKLYVLDSGNNRAFTIDRTSVVESLGTTSPNSSSPVQTIQQTNTGSVAALLPQPNFTGTGDTSVFSITPQSSLGCTGGESLTSGTTCLLAAQFNPVALTTSTATYTEANITPALPFTPTITLSGIGANLRPTTSVTVLTSPATGNPQFGTPFVVSTTVTPTQCNTSAPSCVPTGTVQFFIGTTPVGAPAALNASGTASSSIGGQNVGTFNLTAVYNGDSFYGSSTAPAISITVTTGAANAVVTFSSASLPQFQPLTISAKLSSASGSVPTGTVTFLADGHAIGAATLNSSGVAVIVDPLLIDPNTGKPFNPVPVPNSFSLLAGMHAITAVYGGDANYSKSTSSAATLTIQPDAATFTAAFISPTTLAPVGSLNAGTAQGSTALATVMVMPSNTLNGTVTFTCSGLPTNSVCTVTPTSLVFAPVPGVPVAKTVGVTLWTDVAPGTVPTSASSQAIRPAGFSTHSNTALAALLGWPLLLTSFAGVLAFRKRLRTVRLLAAIVFCGLLAGSSMVMSGCSSGSIGPPALTPVGSYKVNLTVSGPNNTSATMPIQFTVAAGVAGQE